MLNLQKLVSLVDQQFPEAVFLKQIKNSRKVLALTIDDVPARNDRSDISIQCILDLIEQHNQFFGTNVKVTFFVTTLHLNYESIILKEIVQKGHEIGNHGRIDHRHSNLSQKEFENEFRKAHQILTQNFNQPIRWFRPGQGFYNKGMIQTLKKMEKEFGYNNKFALASMIPFDTHNCFNDPEITLKNLKLFTFPGAILILHAGFKEQAYNTVEVLKEFLPELYKQNYELVTLSNLFN